MYSASFHTYTGTYGINTVVVRFYGYFGAFARVAYNLFNYN
mgnify:CR=1 FL=1